MREPHREAAVDLRIAAPSPRVHRGLELTRLDSALAIYATLCAALAGEVPGCW